MQKHIFNKYDIRGIIGTELMIDEVEQLTHAIISFYKKEFPEIKKIAVAMDERIDSLEIYKKVSQVIVSCGLQVYFLGVCPTAVFVFGLYQLPVQAGIMITGSDYPKEYNGFKLYLNKKLVSSDQIQDIYQLYLQKVVETTELVGKILPTPIIDQYIEFLWQNFSHLSQYDFSLVIDSACDITNSVIKKLIQKMKWNQVESGYGRSHSQEALATKADSFQDRSIAIVKNAISKTKKSFGIWLDGDASRMTLINQDGSVICAEILFALFAQDILRKKKQAVVVCGKDYPALIQEMIAQQGGTIVPCVNEITLIKDAMEKSGALLGVEKSGHYVFKDRHQGYDDSIYAMCRLLDVLVQERKPLHEVLMKFSNRYTFYEIGIPCLQEQKYAIIKQVSDVVISQNKWKVSQVDGMRAEIGQGWGLLRACNKEPIVSFRCEAKDMQELTEIKKEFKELLKPHICQDVLKNLF